MTRGGTLSMSCPSSRLLESLQQALEARIAAQRFVVRIVFDPVSFTAAVLEHAFQERQRLLAVSGAGLQAGTADDGTGVVGSQLERSLRPFERADLLAVLEEGQRAG